MEWIELIIGGLVGLITSLTLIPFILQASCRYGLNRQASEPHHTHHFAVPRLGGIALAGALVAVVLLFRVLSVPGFILSSDYRVILATSLAMFALGLWDDLSALGARRKFLGQCLIASAAFFCGIGIAHFRIPFTNHILDLGWWAWPVTMFWLVAMTNLINLIDGVDGLAGGICLMLMVLLVYVSRYSGFVSLVTAGMVGALLGFLRYNFPPARIYMGDGGAYFLGFLIGSLTIVTSQKGTIFAALAAPLFVLALPIIDTSLAILRRGMRGLPLFRPDRRHIHHRLLASGHSRRKVVLGLYGFTAFFLVLGASVFYSNGQFFAVFLGVGTLAVILAAGAFNFSREWFSIGRVLGNSLESRADIQYAMSLAHWLALEGNRASDLGHIAGDVVFIARKLGFASLRIRLEDDEQWWPLNGTPAGSEKLFRHSLPRHKYCFLEFGVAWTEPKASPMADAGTFSEAKLNTFSIQAELVAEGWGKAVAAWQARNQLPVRFGTGQKVPSAAAPDLSPTVRTVANTSPIHRVNV